MILTIPQSIRNFKCFSYRNIKFWFCGWRLICSLFYTWWVGCGCFLANNCNLNSRNKYYILSLWQYKYFFLSIGQEPTTWPANNCLQITLCSSTMLSNQLCLARNNILLIHKWHYAFLLLAIALAWKWQIPLLPKDIQTWWSNDKTIIELVYWKISWFISVSQPLFSFGKKLICSPLTNHNILLSLIQ